MSAAVAFASESADLAARLRPSVVSIQSRHGGGSGVIWSADGLVVTNHHVVPGEQARVELHDGRTFEGRLVARDPERDLAILRIEAEELPAVAARTTPVRAGELAFAIGNPWGERAVVTSGVVLVAGEGAVRADVRLAPGNSGGPLVDAAGQVVGINSMIAGGVAVAVPVSAVTRLLSLESAAEPGFLGVTLAPIPLPEGIAASYPAAGGAAMILTAIEPESPAERAGLLPGDLILAIDGRHGVDALTGGLRSMRAGRTLRLSLLRGGEPVDIETVPAVRS